MDTYIHKSSYNCPDFRFSQLLASAPANRPLANYSEAHSIVSIPANESIGDNLGSYSNYKSNLTHYRGSQLAL